MLDLSFTVWICAGNENDVRNSTKRANLDDLCSVKQHKFYIFTWNARWLA